MFSTWKQLFLTCAKSRKKTERSKQLVDEEIAHEAIAHALVLQTQELTALYKSARNLYDVGLKDEIWNLAFSPPDCPNFVKYLGQKVKNYRLQRLLKVEADKQMERLNEGLESSKKTKLI